MSWRKFDTIYVNGCSHTAGGGLYVGGTKELYKEIYGLSWKTEREVNYPRLLGNYFNCDLIDESRCGSGAPRLVRKTFEYIFKVGLENAKKTLFIFQINTPVHRLEYYCSEINDYLIVNVQYEDDGSFKYVTAVDSYSPNEQINKPKFYEGEITKNIKHQLKNYHDPLDYLEKIHNEIIGLFSYLELHGIEYFFGFDNGNISKPVNEKRRINIDGVDTIHQYSMKNNLTIADETNKRSIDDHPGYFGNKKYSEELIQFLEEKLKPTIWVFGDSYSAKSNPEIDPSSYLYTDDFRMKYFKYKGYFPKSYPEIIAEIYDVNLINLATPSYSNENIFQSFSEVSNQIKPNDVLIFGWTYNSRFNLADEKNEMANINIMVNEDHYIDKNLCTRTINEILYNREKYSIYYKWLSNNLKLINQMFNKNLIIHLDFSNTGNVDDYTTNFLKLITPFKSRHQTIKDETNDNNFNGHFSEKGHQDLANDIIKIINEKF